MKAKQAGKNIHVGFPRFKSRKNGFGSFRLTGAIHVFEKAIQRPRLGMLRLKVGSAVICQLRMSTSQALR